MIENNIDYIQLYELNYLQKKNCTEPLFPLKLLWLSVLIMMEETTKVEEEMNVLDG